MSVPQICSMQIGTLVTKITFVLENAPLLMTEQDIRRADSLLEAPDYVHEALQQNHELLQLPGSGLTDITVRRDPLHLFSPVMARLSALREGDGYSVEDGFILTSDRRAGIGFMLSPYGNAESGQNRELNGLINTAIERATVGSNSVYLTAIGAPLIAVTNADRIKTDGLIAGLLSIVLIALILWYVFRSVKDILWMVLSIATGYAIAIAVMSIYRGELSVIVLGTASVLIGIAANYPLHFLDHRRHEPDTRKALADIVTPLLTGNITTVSAFACLAWMDSEAMRDLGVLGALVLVGTILFVLVLLPVLVSKRERETAANAAGTVVGGDAATAPRGSGSEAGMRGGSEAGKRVSAWHSKLEKVARSSWFLLVMVALTCIFGYFSLRTTFDTNLQNINYMTEEQRANLSLLNVGLEGVSGNAVMAVAEASTADEALQRAEVMADSLEAEGFSVKSISGLIPSQQCQAEAIERWQSFVQCHSEILRDKLPQEGRAIGFSARAFEPFLSMLDADLQPLAFDDFAPVRDVVGAQFLLSDDAAGVTRVINYITISDDEKQEWRDRFSGMGFVFDSRDVQSSLATTLSDDFNYIGFVCGFVVFFFLWLSMASLELSLMSFLPLAVGWIWILGIMHLFGIQFNIVNIILATFIFGQGDDYTIFITEGLVYEHTYGRPILKNYKQSVALSALLMFVGIGSLILARHPAMRSLGEVVIIGMFTVVLMAFYLPPLVFRWITTEQGKLREVPLTLERIAFTVFASVFYLVVASVYQIFAFLWSHIGTYTERKKLFFHRTLCRISRFCIEHVPGTTWSVSNPNNETLERPAIIVANHQSQLDLVAVLSIAPKVVIVTKKWVWNNPLYSLILRAAEFYPITEGVEESREHLESLISRGYSIVVFPEGTRSKDRQIHRFHQGAFHLAQTYDMDILPVFFTGLGDVLPKDELAFRRGQMHMEIGKRMRPDEFANMETRTLTRNVHKYFVQHCAELRRDYQKAAAVVPYVRYQYMYKEVGVKREALRKLKDILANANQIDQWNEGSERLIENSGQGELAFVFALVHPDVQVIATDPDPDKIAVARNVNIHLSNLRFESA